MLQKNPCTKRQSLGSSAHQNLRQEFGQSARCQDTEMRRGKIGKERAAFWILYPSVSIWCSSVSNIPGCSWACHLRGLPWTSNESFGHTSSLLCLILHSFLHVFCMSSACLVLCHTGLSPSIEPSVHGCGTKPQSQTKPWTSWAFTGHAQPSSTFQGTQQQFTTPKNILLD